MIVQQTVIGYKHVAMRTAMHACYHVSYAHAHMSASFFVTTISQGRSHVVKGGAVRKGEDRYGSRSAPKIF